MISCHNRADLARIEHDPVLARALASEAIERMIDTAGDPAAPIILRAGAVQNLGKALAYLAELACEDHAVAADMAEYISRARHAARTVLKVVEHADAPAMAGDCAAMLSMLHGPKGTRQ